MFAKLYERNGKQVLVKMDQSSDKCLPEVRYYFEPERLGVCNVAVEFKDDSDESWDKCEALFKTINEENAWEFVDKVMEDMDRMI